MCHPTDNYCPEQTAMIVSLAREARPEDKTCNRTDTTFTRPVQTTPKVTGNENWPEVEMSEPIQGTEENTVTLPYPQYTDTQGK